jgi:transcription elongation factor GreA
MRRREGGYMNTATKSWITARGLQKLGREKSELRQWLNRIELYARRSIADHKTAKDISLILSKEHIIADRLQRVETAYRRSKVLPPLWSHKTEARAGDTVYLRHRDTIRALLLSAAWDANPSDGTVAVTSPIGLALIGRHVGDRVRLSSLDGKIEYQILKII